MVQVSNEFFFTEKGKRNNNEDNAGFLHGKLYIVCDGVGGHEKGEIASEIVVQTYLKNNNNSQPPLGVSLVIAEKSIGEYLSSHPDSKGMGTTLTVLQIKQNGIQAGWVGDSRIYQFRNGQIVFQSKDHSWVNEALAAGIITEEEAINHPKSNIITRAIQGSQNPAKIEEVFLTDIEKGDLFFLCSDGVLESWTNEDFVALFTTENNLEILGEKIKKECSQNSKDNFTGVLFEIKHVDNTVTKPIRSSKLDSNEILVEAVESKNPSIHSERAKRSEPEFDYGHSPRHLEKKSNSKIIILSVGIILLCLAGLFYYLRDKNGDDKSGGNKDGNKGGNTHHVTDSPKPNVEPIKKEPELNQNTDSEKENTNISSDLNQMIKDLQKGKEIYTDTLLSSNENHNLFKAHIRYKANNWEYQDKTSKQWKAVVNNKNLLNNRFPGVQQSSKPVLPK